MNDEQAHKQLEHMVKFIIQEAKDKVKEIKAKANTEMSVEKDQIIREEQERIDTDFDRRMKQIEVKKKIDYSNELNNCRLAVLKTKEEGVQELLNTAFEQLSNLTTDSNSYTDLLYKLILQALGKLRESNVRIICREEDLQLVEKVYQKAADEYKKKTGQSVQVSVSKDTFLPPGKNKATGPEMCSGGVVLSTPDGKILCSNTLDGRLAQAFEGTLPQIRTLLFGASKTRVHYD
eukprot:TRINITY_DN4747_c0_g2_i1.p1 TRINITY_DN4747_c0_g2~~TRINITY_DN4747_c0_g2_i1.p1  ORF type:complete len:234 (+),score=45.33 TRINITY_DN4747_c0_g2_i1:106-807(+)